MTLNNLLKQFEHLILNNSPSIDEQKDFLRQEITKLIKSGVGRKEKCDAGHREDNLSCLVNMRNGFRTEILKKVLGVKS
jgi:hypothetical protein